jgi:hypothetical protein
MYVPCVSAFGMGCGGLLVPMHCAWVVCCCDCGLDMCVRGLGCGGLLVPMHWAWVVCCCDCGLGMCVRECVVRVI